MSQVGKETQEGEAPIIRMNVTMMFTGSKERVEFTSEHVYQVPKEPNGDQKDADQSTPEPGQPQEANQENGVPQ